MNVGFIGLGIMGGSMARNLMAGGHRLHAFTRSRSRAESILAEGALWADSAAAVAHVSDIVITMVGMPDDVEQVYFGEDGILAAAKPGTLLIDMGTTPPALAKRIDVAARAAGLRALDAPVSGGDVGARAGTLSIMVGGLAQDLAEVMPVLSCMGRTIVHVGPAGSGQHCKMVNQIVIAGMMAGVSEGLAYATRTGLDTARVLTAVGAGAAASTILGHLGPKMVTGDFTPGFLVEHLIKDLGIAKNEGESLGLDLPILALVLEQYRRVADSGGGRTGTQSLYGLYSP